MSHSTGARESWMTSYPSLPGLAGLTARTIYCIGRNYAEHAKELGNAVPTEPVVFLKPLSSLAVAADGIVLPPQSQRVDHEVELVVAMGQQASWVSEGEAERCIAGVGVGIDVTARDLQEKAKAKAKALPWAIAKGFDSFAVLGAFGRPEGNLGDCTLQLSVNGEIRQHGRTADMLFSVPRLISFLSSIFTLYPGDLIFTGTPPGVAPLREGDRVQASLLHANSGTILSTLETTVRTHSGRPESKGRESEDMSDERV